MVERSSDAVAPILGRCRVVPVPEHLDIAFAELALRLPKQIERPGNNEHVASGITGRQPPLDETLRERRGSAVGLCQLYEQGVIRSVE